MIINRNNIFDVINKSNCKPDKDYGQNFLIEPTIAEKIVSLLNVKDEDKVLEIGPGIGSLTHFLNGKNNSLTIVDIDRRMCDLLHVIYPQLNIVCDDIRKVDVTNYTKIIANLPYNITTEIIIYLLFNAKKCSKMTLMCQSETYYHFGDVFGSEYGPTSVLVHLLGNIKKEFNVKAGCFIPQPKCVSTVFTIEFNKQVNREEAYSCYKFCKKIFSNRRKTILNNLLNNGVSKQRASEVLQLLNIKELSRPEEITPLQFLELSKLCL